MPQQQKSLDFPYQTPGALRGSAVLALHSRQAARLVQGRPRKKGRAAILGLFGFAGALRPIHEGLAKHDPYASWWLKKVEHEIQHAEEIVSSFAVVFDKSIDPSSGFSSAEVTSELPMLVELRFASREAYAAARILANFDRIVLQALGARHIGLASSAFVRDLIDQGGRALRRLFFSPIGYQCTGVTVSDIRADNRVARRARERMGLLPDDLANVATSGSSELAPSADSGDGEQSNSTVLTAAQ